VTIRIIAIVLLAIVLAGCADFDHAPDNDGEWNNGDTYYGNGGY